MSLTLKDLREWMEQLPPEFDDFGLVIGERGMYNEEYSYRLDKPVVTLDVDEETNEIVFLHQNINEGNNRSIAKEFPLVDKLFSQPKSDELSIMLESKPREITPEESERLAKKWEKVLNKQAPIRAIIIEAQERQLTDEEMKERQDNGNE